MNDPVLDAIRDRIQEDVNKRGLRSDPVSNLCTALPDDFAAACRSLARASGPHLVVVTGFLIPTAEPPAGETDGPLGAVFLARALAPLGIEVSILSDAFCLPALSAGLRECGLPTTLAQEVPGFDAVCDWTPGRWLEWARAQLPGATHLLALERVGPSYTPGHLARHLTGHVEADQLAGFFLDEVPEVAHDRCHTMRGRDITASMSPVHHLFEAAGPDTGITTLGIGDGGNEIGMGRMPWSVIRKNIPRGAQIACRIATERLIVAGISNWGAYGLAAGIWHLRRQTPPREIFAPAVEQGILTRMVEAGLVDGVTNRPTVSVDGLDFERYGAILSDLTRAIL